MPENVEDLIKDVIDDVEDLFQPKPGGMIDRHRQEKAQREAAAREAENRAEKVEEKASFAVKVTPLSPEIVAMTTVTIQPGATAMLLPNSPYRCRALVSIDTLTSKVILAKDASQALGGVGFTYSTGDPLELTTRAQVYGFNPGMSAITVSILSEIYAPETK